MCDERTESDLSRREFGTALGGAAVAGLVPTVACAAAGLVEKDVLIKTADGVVDAHFAYPGKGKHAAVIVWPDIWGLRPAFREMGRKLAGQGYAVLTVNQFYRDVKTPIQMKGDNPRSPDNFAMVRGYMMNLTPDKVVKDAEAFVAWLDTQKPVSKSRKMGVTGYCMGGPLVVRTAAAVPARVGAGATFHAIPLVTDTPDSPHLLLPKTKAAFHIATAKNDDEQRPDEKAQFVQAMKAAGIKGDVEVYPAMHGWVPPGGPAHDPVQAERAWAKMLTLFKAELG